MRSLSLVCPALLVLALGPARGSAQPGPLDRLDPGRIPAETRKFLSVEGLVGFVRGHDRAVASVAFSPDGKLLASAGWDNTVRLWKLGGPEPAEWATLPGSPSAVAFHPKGDLLAAGGRGTAVHLWDVTGEKPRPKHTLAGHKHRPFALAFAPTGTLLVSGSFEPVLRLWKLDGAEPEAWGVLANEDAPSRGIASLAFGRRGRLLVAGGHLGRQTLRVWDAAGSYLEELDVPAARARLVACSPAGPVLAFSGDDAPIRLWSLAARPFKEVRTLPGHAGRGLPPAVKALAFAPDGRRLASAGQDRRLVVWDVETGMKAREWQLLDEVRALAFAPDGRHLAAGNDDGTLYLLRLAERLPPEG